MGEPHVIVLGGGPAGYGAAYRLRREGKARVTLVERNRWVGGNAGSFEAANQFLDFGSHRLHSACDPGILQDLKDLLGDDLIHRDRHGRIHLRGKWLHFPLKLMDLMLRLDRAFAYGVAKDMFSRNLFGKGGQGDTFASVLRANLGGTICDHFYYPYARKLWGLEPEQLSAVQARKRVSAGTVGKILKRILKPKGGNKFYYPRKGYGQITQAYAEESRKLGANQLLGWTASRIERSDGQAGGFNIKVTGERGETKTISADFIWSTIPLTILCQLMSPPADVLQACGNIAYRSMILIYLTLPVSRYSATDAHYFPEEHIRMTRMSEPKNYAGANEPKETTTLCAELPCRSDDEAWNMSDEELGELILEDMRTAGLPVHQPVKVFSRRLQQAYPIYATGYEKNLRVVDAWVKSIPKLLVFGRQGLFAHDNTHHTLYMAYAAADCLQNDGRFNHERWAEYREIFATHVVED